MKRPYAFAAIPTEERLASKIQATFTEAGKTLQKAGLPDDVIAREFLAHSLLGLCNDNDDRWSLKDKAQSIVVEYVDGMFDAMEAQR